MEAVPAAGRRRTRALLVTVALVAAVAAFSCGAALWAAHAQMTASRQALRRGADALISGDADKAVAAFGRAGEHASAAGARLSSPPLRAAAVLPLAGRQLQTARALATAAGLVARSGHHVAAGVRDIDGGLAAIVPSDGRFPVEPLRDLQPRLERAAELNARAHALVRGTSGGLLLAPLHAARDAARNQLQVAARSLEVAGALADALPAFLGADGPRQYLFGAATPAEVRGTGGLIGAYAPMTARDGAISFGSFIPASDLPRAVDDPPPPPTEDYQHRYGEFAAAGHWSNVNMTPDFPTAAVAIERLYARTGGAQVDGTVVADPFALQLLLQATGPIDVPGAGRIRPGTVVDFLTHDGYVDLPDPAARKAVLGRVAVTVFETFLRSDATPQRKVRLLAEAVTGGHVLLHARDDDVQAALVRADVAGRLLRTSGDFLAVVANNAAGNKVDYFARRALKYRVDLVPDGSAQGRLQVDIANRAPPQGLPRYVIGPSDDRFLPGENVMLLSTYCSDSCRSDGYRVDGKRTAIGQLSELGMQVLPTRVRVRARSRRSLVHDLRVLRAWEPTDGGGVYRLTLQGQPTVRPTRVALRIRVPEGMRVTGVSGAARVSDEEVRWTGVLGRAVQVEVAFTRERAGWQRLAAWLDPSPPRRASVSSRRGPPRSPAPAARRSSPTRWAGTARP